MKPALATFIVAVSASSCLAGDLPCTVAPADPDFIPIFDGKSLDGWKVSGKTGHGTGGKWVVKDGAIVGSQDTPGNGGIILTQEQYGDFEVSLEMGNDYGPDSGLFLRSTEDGRCYQAMIDYHNNGNIMGVYGEGIGAFAARNFRTLGQPNEIRTEDYPPFPAPFTPEQYRQLWKPKWNHVKARITGNPPTIHTWINGVKVMEWTDTEKRLPDRGAIGLQVHGGGDFTKQFVRYRNIKVRRLDVPDNTLSPEEEAAGWILLFDGKMLDGWMTNKREPSKTPVEDHSINPHKSGGYMVVHEKQWGDFVLALDFKISKGCNSGVFFRTNPLLATGRVGYQGLEMAIDDTGTAGMHDTGAIYDLVTPCRNAMKPAGAWNHAVITCDGPKVSIELNGERVTDMNLDEWEQVARRPDGSTHKFSEKAWKDHPRIGYIGLQDHGSPCWFKNIKILPLKASEKVGR